MIEAEYVAATKAGKEMIWLHGFLNELGKKQEIGILHSDSQSAIFLAKNSVFHSKLKHIQTKYHFFRYLVEDKLVILEKIFGSKNPIDMLTKGVTIEKLNFWPEKLYSDYHYVECSSPASYPIHLRNHVAKSSLFQLQLQQYTQLL